MDNLTKIILARQRSSAFGLVFALKFVSIYFDKLFATSNFQVIRTDEFVVTSEDMQTFIDAIKDASCLSISPFTNGDLGIEVNFKGVMSIKHGKKIE